MIHTNNGIIEIIEEEPGSESDFKDPDKHRSCLMSKWVLVGAILASLCSAAAIGLGIIYGVRARNAINAETDLEETTDGDDDYFSNYPRPSPGFDRDTLNPTFEVAMQETRAQVLEAALSYYEISDAHTYSFEED
eukprot:18829-Ditylum_brightwellii.AAC.1